MTWKLEIEVCENGFILTNIDTNYPEELTRYVFSYEDNELTCVVSLLHAIQDCLGYYGSKHDLERIFIRKEIQGEYDGREEAEEVDAEPRH